MSRYPQSCPSCQQKTWQNHERPRLACAPGSCWDRRSGLRRSPTNRRLGACHLLVYCDVRCCRNCATAGDVYVVCHRVHGTLTAKTQQSSLGPLLLLCCWFPHSRTSTASLPPSSYYWFPIKPCLPHHPVLLFLTGFWRAGACTSWCLGPRRSS